MGCLRRRGWLRRLVWTGRRRGWLCRQGLGEEGSIELGAAFKEEAEDIALGEGGEDCGEAQVAGGVLREAEDFDAAWGGGSNWRFGWWGRIRHRGLGDRWGAGGGLGGGADQAGVGGGAEVGVEDDAEEGASAG